MLDSLINTIDQSDYIQWCYIYIPVNPPLFRGTLPRKSLISRMDWVSCAGDINLMGNFQKYWSQNVGEDFIVLDFLLGGYRAGD
jgi:hypothetical protein